MKIGIGLGEICIRCINSHHQYNSIYCPLDNYENIS